MTLDECDIRFAAIRSPRNDADLAAELRSLFLNYRVLSFQFGRGSVFWRGRRADCTPFHSIDDMSHPPAKYARAGRLNDDGHPCLYAATRRSTVLSELEAKVGEYFQFLGFRIRPSHIVRLGAIGELFHVHKTGYLRSLGVDPGSGISRLLNSAGIELGTRLLYIDAFLASLLADREAQSRDYLLTRLLAKMAYEQSSADGFFYPSVEDHNGMNIAMLPEAYSSHTHAVCCQFVRVTKVREFGFFEYEVILDSTGITDAWGIKWKQPIAKHSTAFFGLTESELSFLRRHPESNGNSFLELVGLGQSDG